MPQDNNITLEEIIVGLADDEEIRMYKHPFGGVAIAVIKGDYSILKVFAYDVLENGIINITACVVNEALNKLRLERGITNGSL